jgi:hypothetical protein
LDALDKTKMKQHEHLRKRKSYNFWANVTIKDETQCWLWQGSVDAAGYGRMNRIVDGRKFYRAHQLAFYLSKGNSQDLYICHECDNPTCCNPKHLFLGTALENTQDRDRKGRTAKGERLPIAKLKEEDIPVILKLKSTGLNNHHIGKKLGVSHETIRNVLAGNTWKHVQKQEAK